MKDTSFSRFFDVTKNPQPRLENKPPKKPKHRGMIVWFSSIQGTYIKDRDKNIMAKYYGE